MSNNDQTDMIGRANIIDRNGPPNQTPCPSAEEIYAYASGGFDEQHATDLEAHLLMCTQCETLLEGLDDPSDAIIRALTTLPISPDDEIVYQELRKATLVKPPEFKDSPKVANALQHLRRLADPDLGPLPYKLGNYELQDCIGRGASGAVYRARHLKLDQLVAIKVLDASRSLATDSFLQEMKTIGSLAHPHIVRATDAGEADGLHFLVMEFVDGIDAAKLLYRLGPLRVADACEIARQAALGLQFVHEKALVHRDIKPSNLLVTIDGQVKILDLGIAIRSDATLNHSEDAKPQGTSDYMAPEQWTHSGHVDHRADLYSLGCTLFRLLTGNIPPKPYAAGNEIPAEIPRPIERLLQRLLAPAAEDRPSSVDEVIELLQPHVRGADLCRLVATACPSLPLPTHATQIPPRRITRRQAVLATLATAGAAALLFPRLRLGKTPRLRRSQWRPLVPVAPEIFLTSGSPDEVEVIVEPSDCILVRSKDLALVHLGRPVVGQFTLQVELQQRDWAGDVGLFFQGRRLASDAAQFVFQTVELRPPDPEHDLLDRRLLWSGWKAENRSGRIHMTRNAWAEAAVEIDTSRKAQRLSVTLGLSGLPVVHWNDGKLDVTRWKLSSEGRNRQQLSAEQISHAFLGKLGLINVSGVNQFLRPRLQYL